MKIKLPATILPIFFNCFLVSSCQIRPPFGSSNGIPFNEGQYNSTEVYFESRDEEQEYDAFKITITKINREEYLKSQINVCKISKINIVFFIEYRTDYYFSIIFKAKVVDLNIYDNIDLIEDRPNASHYRGNGKEEYYYVREFKVMQDETVHYYYPELTMATETANTPFRSIQYGNYSATMEPK